MKKAFLVIASLLVISLVLVGCQTEVIKTKYVCDDGREVDYKQKCFEISECETGTMDWSSLDCVQTTRKTDEQN